VRCEKVIAAGKPNRTGFAHDLPNNKSLNRFDVSDDQFAFDGATLEALRDGIRGSPSLTAVTVLN
jgi:hypothetical protein